MPDTFRICLKIEWIKFLVLCFVVHPSFSQDDVQSKTFANTQMNPKMQVSVNGCNASSSFTHTQGANYATEAMTGCIEVPAGSTVHNANGVDGFANVASPSTIGVGGYFQGWAKTNAVNVEGLNGVAIDSSGLTKGVKLVAIEADVQPQNQSSAYEVVNGVLVDLFTPKPGTHLGSIGVNVTSGQVGIFDMGFATSDGKVARAFYAGALCGSGTCDSQAIQFHGLKSNASVTSNIGGTSIGDLKITPAWRRSFYVSNSHYGTARANSDASGTIFISSANSASYTFSVPWNSAPVCILTPQTDPTTVGGWWVTTSISLLTAHIKSSGSITFNYICMGNPN